MGNTDIEQATLDPAPRLQPTAASAEAPRFSVVIPCYNEEQNIVPLLAEIFGALERRVANVEIIVVDDGSTDRTKEHLLHAKYEMALPIRLIAHSCKLGQSAGLCTAIDAARGEWIVTMDGDGQNDPRDLVALLDRIDQAAFDPATGVVCGHRRHRRDTWIRRLSSIIANGVRSRVLGDATPDTGCGLKLIRRDVFLNLPRFDHMHRFLPALAQRGGSKVVSVAVGHRPRLKGESKYGIHNRLWVGVVDLLGVMWLKRRAFKESVNEEL